MTTYDRDGARQVENAVSLMLRIVNDFAANSIVPRRRIADIEKQIVNDRQRLNEIDNAISKIAQQHFDKVPGTNQSPFDLAKKLMAEQSTHQWFLDRPTKDISESGVDDILVDTAIKARKEVGENLIYIDTELPSSHSMPDEETVSGWRNDLRRAHNIESDLPYSLLTRRLLAKVGIARAKEIAEQAQKFAACWNRIAQIPWAFELLKRGISEDEHIASCKAQIETSANEFWANSETAKDFSLKAVFLPEQLPPADDLHHILSLLATGGNPFGLLAFRLKQYKPIFARVLINGKRAETGDDWKHVAKYLTLQAQMHETFARFRALTKVLEIPYVQAELTIASNAKIGSLFAQALDLPPALRGFLHELDSAIEDHKETEGVATAADNLLSFAASLELRISQSRLMAVRQKVKDLKKQIHADGSPLCEYFAEALAVIEQFNAESDEIFLVWDEALEKLKFVESQRDYLTTIANASLSLEHHGAPMLANWMTTRAASNFELSDSKWRNAWHWWSLYSRLTSIGGRQALKQLTRERLLVDERLRDSLAELVRERAFYELAKRMPGQAKSALKAFSDLIRRLGKGTGKKAAMQRRELRSAMLKCYDAVPCWIMPTWRVSEQLPSTFGSFDLVIMDEASQSDAKELPAIFRGKKVLIVGDDRQVSPTDAFIKHDDIERLRMNYLRDLPFPSHLLPGSSIYELARVMFPDKYVMLKEHFRCVEPIIRFSMQFYNEPLIPLRIPTAQERLDPPLVDILVKDGVRHPTRKINQREVEVVVQEIKRIVFDPICGRIGEPNSRPRSIGVVSLIGSEQARLIQSKLIEELGEQKFMEHKIICGDSATMQGNERDIVFLSMVAAPGSRIGAQTAEQYRRRFNVALSRAKDRMYLVRSIEERHLNPNDLKAKVIQHFRDPMPKEMSAVEHSIELCQSEFERGFFQRLNDLGYSVRSQVGSSGFSIDLVVEGANGRRLAVECDGDLYHGPERWAADMRRQRILERVGWTFWRVFGSNYELDREAVFDDLIQTLDTMGIKPGREIISSQIWTEHRVVTIGQPDIAQTDASNISDRGLNVGDRIILEYLGLI